MTTESKPATRKPRAALAAWANDKEEWVRQIVEFVLTTDSAMPEDAALSVFGCFKRRTA